MLIFAKYTKGSYYNKVFYISTIAKQGIYKANLEILNNVYPCVLRRTLLRDESIVLELQFFSYYIYKVVIDILLSLTISP